MDNFGTWRKSLAAVAVVATMGVANPATADELQTIGWANGYQSFGLSIGGSPPAGGFIGIWEGDEIDFWCVELTQYFNPGTTYTNYVGSIPDDDTYTKLGQLFTQAYAMALTSPQYSAAFQLAIWEIVYDADLSLGAGDFRVLNNNYHADTVAIAQGWLTNLWKYDDEFDLVFLSSPGPNGHQDFVTPRNPPEFIPEPGSLPLFAIAVLALTLALRRRARSSGGNS